MIVTIYIPKKKLGVWQTAEKLANLLGQSRSARIVRLLEQDITDNREAVDMIERARNASESETKPAGSIHQR